jgi:hypothetical protein
MSSSCDVIQDYRLTTQFILYRWLYHHKLGASRDLLIHVNGINSEIFRFHIVILSVNIKNGWLCLSSIIVTLSRKLKILMCHYVHCVYYI